MYKQILELLRIMKILVQEFNITRMFLEFLTLQTELKLQQNFVRLHNSHKKINNYMYEKYLKFSM